MASVPSIGCLLAKNQYYRKSSISSDSSLTGSDSVNFMDDDKFQQGFPEVAESTWWFKSFFHPGPVLSNVRSKDPSTALIVDAGNQDVLPAEVPRGKPSISSTAANAEDFFLCSIHKRHGVNPDVQQLMIG
ncbi:pancreatic progenitor cell differentiation and proliferation factor-like protein isoform X5 [Oryctolagus cuniculus]|uniref:pancreatic progenitor cell differentiation and proliferation factor-like protein isoform X5 n=1 Tax=Oryctolagus cuniculus TaxID=9986 RepID=UPI0038791311